MSSFGTPLGPDSFAARKPALAPFPHSPLAPDDQLGHRCQRASEPHFRTMTFSFRHAAVLSFTILLGLFNSTLLVATPPPATLRDHVELTAWLDAGSAGTADVIVEVNVNGVMDWSRPAQDGSVELVLPADAVALISFRKDGHRTKTVSVDTHNMQEGAYKGKRRNLTIGVLLDDNSDNEAVGGTSPVGVIAFNADGTMAVQHNQKLVPKLRQEVQF